MCRGPSSLGVGYVVLFAARNDGMEEKNKAIEAMYGCIGELKERVRVGATQSINWFEPVRRR